MTSKEVLVNLSMRSNVRPSIEEMSKAFTDLVIAELLKAKTVNLVSVKCSCRADDYNANVDSQNDKLTQDELDKIRFWLTEE